MTLRARLAEVLRIARAARSVAGWAQYRGVRIVHPGILVDQARCADAVDAGYGRLRESGYEDGPAIAATMGRVTVRFVGRLEIAPRLGVSDLSARWCGGFFDRGEILLRHRGEWPAHLAQALADLCAVELHARGHRPAPKMGDPPAPKEPEAARG